MSRRRDSTARFGAAAIAARRFGIVPRGFDPDEVLIFLNEIAVALHAHEGDADRVVDEARTRAIELLARVTVRVDEAMVEIERARAATRVLRVREESARAA